MVQLARNRALAYQLRVPNTLLNSCLPVYSAAKVTYLYNVPQATVTAFHTVLYYFVLESGPGGKCSSHAPIVCKMQYDRDSGNNN